MTWALVLAGLFGLWAWAWRSGNFRRIRIGDVLAVAAVVAAVRLLASGQWVGAALAAAGVLAYLHNRRRVVIAPPGRVEVDEARRLLEVPADADADAIRTAHRRISRLVHPDAGGTAELAARINAARDILLAELKHADVHQRR